MTHWTSTVLALLFLPGLLVAWFALPYVLGRLWSYVAPSRALARRWGSGLVWFKANGKRRIEVVGSRSQRPRPCNDGDSNSSSEKGGM